MAIGEAGVPGLPVDLTVKQEEDRAIIQVPLAVAKVALDYHTKNVHVSFRDVFRNAPKGALTVTMEDATEELEFLVPHMIPPFWNTFQQLYLVSNQVSRRFLIFKDVISIQRHNRPCLPCCH